MFLSGRGLVVYVMCFLIGWLVVCSYVPFFRVLVVSSYVPFRYRMVVGSYVPFW
jgi:hypothetical protein